MKITFLGGGNMASALAGGMVHKGQPASDVTVIDLQADKRAHLQQELGVCTADAADDAALACDVLVLAVKPQQLKAALAPVAGRLGPQLVVSIAAGMRIETVSRWLGGHARIVRAMPNTPALIGAGVTGLYAAPAVNDAERASAAAVLSAVGSVVWVNDEALIDGVTALSGSGPAYVFRFIEALEAAGVEMGFAPEAARRLALDTVLGSARLAAQSSETPAVLRERVTSPGGTTEAALASFERDGFMAMVARALRAAEARSRELGDALGKG